MTRQGRLLFVLAAAAAVGIVAAAAVRLFVPPWLHSRIERGASEALGRRLEIAGAFDLSFSLRPTFEAENVTLANAPRGSEPVMIRAARIRLSVALRSLWSPPLRIEDLELDGVRVLLETDARGRGNWELERNKPPNPPRTTRAPVVFGHAAIRDFELVHRSGRDAAPLRLGVKRLEARLEPVSGMVELDVAGYLNDSPWGFSGRLGTLDRLLELRDVEQDVSGHVGDSKLALRGRIRDPLALGDPNVEVEIEGPDIAAALATVGLRSPFEGPFRARGRFSPAKDGVDIDLIAEHSGVTASVRGRVGALLDPKAFDARVEASGPDASVVGGWASVAGIPKQRFEIAGRVRRDGSRFSVEELHARVGGTTLNSSGAIGAPPRWAGTELALQATGSDLSELSALTRLGLPAGSFAVSGRFVRGADALAVERVELRTQDSVLTADGTIGEPPGLEGLDLALDASGPDLSRFSQLATVALPREPFRLRGRVARAGAAFVLTGGEGRLGRNSVTLEGTVARAPRLVGSDLGVRFAGPDLAGAASLFGLRGLPAGPYEVSGRVRLAPDGYRLDSVEARAAGLSARVAGRVGARPAEDGTDLEVSVEGGALSDLAAWGVEAKLPPEPFRVSGNVRIENRVLGIERAEAEVGADRASFDGTLGPLPGLSQLDIGVELAGPRLADLVRFVSAAGSEPKRRLPIEPYTLSARVRRSPAGLDLSEARATVGEAEIRLEGTLGSGEKLRGTNLRFEARAPETALAAQLAGVTLPDAPIALRGRIERVDSGFRFDGVSASIGDAQAEVSGMLGEPPDRAGTDLEVTVAGPDLAAALGPITGLSPLPSDAFEASAHLAGNARRIASDRFVARLGESDLAGSVSVRLDGRPAVEADLRSRHLGIPRLPDGFLGEPAATPAPPKTGPRPAREKDRLLPDEPLQLGFLRSLDARLRLTAAELAIPGMPLRDVTVEAALEDGALRVNRLEGTGERGGHATARLSVTPVDDGAYRVQASGGIAGGRFVLPKATDAPELAPTLDVEFELEGTGRSLHAIAASGVGGALVTLGPGRIPSNLSDSVTSGVLRGLLDALNPFRKSSPYTEVECGVVAADLENGKAVVEPVALRTDKLTVIGRGKVDFQTEKIDLEWTLKPREGVGITAGSIANPYIKLGGTLSSPSLDAKPLAAVASTGAAVATAGMTILFRGVYDRVTAEKKVCVKALEDAAKQAEKREARKGP